MGGCPSLIFRSGFMVAASMLNLSPPVPSFRLLFVRNYIVLRVRTGILLTELIHGPYLPHVFSRFAGVCFN